MNNIERLKYLGDPHFKTSLFHEVTKEVKYSKDDIFIGTNALTGKPFAIDYSEANRFCNLGLTRCLDLDTEIKTTKGNKKLKDLNDTDIVYSYNFDTKKISTSNIILYDETEQELYEMILKDGSRVCASKLHKFFNMKGKIEIKNIKKGELITIETKDDADATYSRVKSIKKIGNRKCKDIFVFKNNNFFLSNGILSSNSGKTFMMRLKGDRLYKAGRAVVYLTDVKDEFKSSRYPVQKKFENLLMENEKPEGFKIVTLRPTFFKEVRGYTELPENNFWYSPDLLEMSKADFITFFSNVAKGDIKTLALDSMYFSMLKIVEKLQNENKQRAKKGTEEIDYSLYDVLLDTIEILPEEFSEGQKNSFRRMIIPLKESTFFEKKYVRNITKLMQKGYIIAINLNGFEKLGTSAAFVYPEVVLSLVLREIIDARIAGKIPNVYVFLDECVRFIGKQCKSSFKYSVSESFDLHTKFGVNYDIATQYIEKIDEGMLEQCRYLAIPRTATTNTIQRAIVSFGLTKNIQRSVNDSITLKNKMSKYPHSWLILDRTTGDQTIVLPTAPLSNHMETED